MKKTLSVIIFAILLGGFIYLGTRDYKNSKESDNVIFSNEFEGIDENNIFVYTHASKVIQTLKKGSGIIFFGFKEDIWAGYYANILNEVAMSLGINEIYYYDFFEDRSNYNGTYESIVKLLNEYVITLDDGTKNIYSPSVVIVSDGNIVAFNDDTAIMRGKDSPEEYWTESQINIEKIKLSSIISNYINMEANNEW